MKRVVLRSGAVYDSTSSSPANKIVEGTFRIQESLRLVKFNTESKHKITIPLESIDQIRED